MSNQGRKERRVASKACCKHVFCACFADKFAVLFLAMIIACAIATPEVHAQGYPTKPVRVVVPNTAGSLIDVLVRQVIPAMSSELGQTS